MIAITSTAQGAILAGSSPHQYSRRVAADLVGFCDMLMVVAAIAVPAILTTGHDGPVLATIDALRAGLIGAIIAYGCLRNWRLYETQHMDAFPFRPEKLAAASALAAVAVFGLAAPIGKMDHATLVTLVATWFVGSSALLIINRLVAGYLLRTCAQAGCFDERVAVYGAGEIAVRLKAYLAKERCHRRLVGIFDDRIDTARRDTDLPVDGQLADLIERGRRGEIDRIIVAMPQSADRRLAFIARQLEQLPVSVHAVTHFSDDLIDVGPVHHVSNLGPVGLIDVKRRPLADWAPALKRVEDLVLSLLICIVTAPIILAIAIAIKLDSRGPVFFRQRRRGLNQNVITVLKFRTMTVQEDGAEIRQAVSHDSRVTRVGQFLRRSSLDELPQLYNVLIGEMSLVGPRPHALAHDDQWGALLDRYANRHQVKPGITGLAQVRGLRGEARCEKDLQDRTAADLEYIANWSLWLDLRIIATTVWAVIGAKNAY